LSSSLDLEIDDDGILLCVHSSGIAVSSSLVL
jgi:hypothetical protein